MASRPIASLTISFGLVSIPVKLFSATQSSGIISFNLLHEACGSRLKQQYVCAKEGVVVPREEIVKGYEFAKDQYVMFTPAELTALEEVGAQMIEIGEFVPLESVDPVYFDRVYYLGPDKGGAKPYALLAKALRDSDRCALGKWAARGKQYIVMVRPLDDGLVMQQLLYATEVKSIGEVDLPKTQVKSAELDLARKLIDQQSSDTFDPASYTDEVRERIEAAIRRKVEGEEIAVAEEAPAKAQVIDLMEALRASLAKKAVARGKPAERKAARPAKRARTASAARKARGKKASG